MLYKVYFEDNKVKSAEQGTEEKELEWSKDHDQDVHDGLKVWKGKNLKEYVAIFVEADDEENAIKKAQEIADKSAGS